MNLNLKEAWDTSTRLSAPTRAWGEKPDSEHVPVRWFHSVCTVTEHTNSSTRPAQGQGASPKRSVQGLRSTAAVGVLSHRSDAVLLLATLTFSFPLLTAPASAAALLCHLPQTQKHWSTAKAMAGK